MRDVIVIGTGAGGPVIAKEPAAKGLDVLLLEAGAAFAEPEREWTRFENDAINFYTGFMRFGPADRSKRPWLRELLQASLLIQCAGVGGTTKIFAGNSPRAMPGAFRDCQGSDRDAYDTAHLFPFGYRELIPYYEWVEHTLPVETAPMGRKEEAFFHGASRLGLPVQTTKDTIRAAYRPPGERHPSARRQRRPHLGTAPAGFPRGVWLHVLRPLLRGLCESPCGSAKPAGEAIHR